MERAEAHEFVERWLDAWNARDLEAVLAHFADDVVFTSPFAMRMIDGSDGVLRGKDALRRYWAVGLSHLPDLHFELVDIYLGIDTLVIHYRNQSGGLVAEVLRFAGSQVVEGHGTYLAV